MISRLKKYYVKMVCIEKLSEGLIILTYPYRDTEQEHITNKEELVKV